MSGPTAAVVVRARLERGVVVHEFVLDHGADPVRELAVAGWERPVLRDARREPDGSLVLEYVVARSAELAEAAAIDVPVDPGLDLEGGEEVHPYQRTAAYAVVRSARGILLTELSEQTSSPGRWTLPGGGLDPGEEPVEALHREIWEESGQRVDRVRLLEVQTSHWVGRAPSGRLEDFHAVRIVYAARCPEPTEPVVHDVGGSTAAVAWVPVEEVDSYPLGTSFAPHLRRWLSEPV